MRLQFVLPTTNANGPGRVDLDHLEIFAVTVAPGSVTPPNRDLLTKAYSVGTLEVEPAPIEGKEAAAEPATPDTRPSAGEPASFVEPVTEAVLTPAPLPKAPPPAPAAVAPVPPLPAAGAPSSVPEIAAPAVQPPAAAGTPASPPASVPTAAGAATPAAPAPTYPVRIYVVRGVSKAGRPGQVSARVTVPLVSPPAAPTGARVSFNDKAVVLDWIPPVAEVDGPSIGFNVYRTDAPPAEAAATAATATAAPAVPVPAAPLNPAPLTVAEFETTSVTFGEQLCLAVRGVETVQNVRIEGAATQPVCVTPRDIFPPAAPQRLSLLLLDGAIDLVWDTSPEPDVKGYVVLRGEAAGGTLRPLTPAPIQETTFRDTTVTPGVRYVYAVTAVDGAGNTSAESAHVEGAAR